jgi:hypothetical protein
MVELERLSIAAILERASREGIYERSRAANRDRATLLALLDEAAVVLRGCVDLFDWCDDTEERADAWHAARALLARIGGTDGK